MLGVGIVAFVVVCGCGGVGRGERREGGRDGVKESRTWRRVAEVFFLWWRGQRRMQGRHAWMRERRGLSLFCYSCVCVGVGGCFKSGGAVAGGLRLKRRKLLVRRSAQCKQKQKCLETRPIEQRFEVFR